MSDPTTTNILLAVPNRGADTGTWDVPINGDFAAIDGYLGGVQTISVSNAPITLTAPTGTPTPGGGPTQAQNAVLSFTGALSANVQVTLPLPGSYQIENLTTGNFVLSFKAASAGQVIGLGRGMSERVYCDGTNVRFASLGVVGKTEIWAGLTQIPGWVSACTKRPYLYCDGTVYSVSDYPYLGAQLGASFGGNGLTTFAVPDLRGRVPLPFDGTGVRITAAECGINGMVIGSAADSQSIPLTQAQLPAAIGSTDNVHVATGQFSYDTTAHSNGSAGGFQAVGPGQIYPGASGPGVVNIQSAIPSLSVSNPGGGNTHPNVQPSQVTGIAVIRAA